MIRCIQHTGDHLGAFVDDPKPIPLERVTHLESKEELDIGEDEKELDEKRRDEELEHLGTIGYKNASASSLKFNDAVSEIEKQSKELCQKLYTGDNAKYLTGNDKIPDYLQAYLESMKRQAEEFRINTIRELRESCLSLLSLCEILPKAVFSFLETRFSFTIQNSLQTSEEKYAGFKEEDGEIRGLHLRQFRPNLENPNNHHELLRLNTAEKDRSEKYLDVSCYSNS